MRIYLLLSFVLFFACQSFAQKNYEQTLKLMGSRFDITVVADDETSGQHFIQLAIDEIHRIEKLISSWDPASQTSQINQNAGVNAVIVDEELFNLIQRAIKISMLSDGAFDITYASMDKIWKYDGSMTTLPSPETIIKSVEKVGYQNIILDESNRSVFLKHTGMRIGFGAIGKGYAADRAKELLISCGVKAGIINASGDLNAWGKQANGKDWMVAITNPLNKEKAFAWLPVENAAVVTSGNYEKFIKLEGIRYSHIIDPRTGYPSKGIVSTTIITKSAELADALATAVFVMGVPAGLDIINQLKGVDAIIVDEENKVHTSSGIDLKTNSTYE